MKVLIVRTSAMGDVVHALPVLRALRRGMPQARIAWVVERAFAPLLEGHPDLDLVLPVALRAWRRPAAARDAFREAARALRALRGFAPDVALDLMGNHKAGLLARLSGARRILGPARPHRREPSSAVWITEGVAVAGEHAVDRMLAVAGALGLAASPADFGGDLLLRGPREGGAPPDAGRPYVVLQAGAGWANKVYPPSFWGEVAWRLHRETGLEVRVATAPGEEHLAREVAASSRGAARTVDAASFFDLAALARSCRLFLGGDTGPLHLAHALGAPVLCVMGPTDPRRNGPYAAADRTVYRRLPCSFCYKRFDRPKACLWQLAPAAVVAKGLELLRVVSE